MGTLDFLKAFEGRAIDAVSYKLLQRNFEMQEENNLLLKERCELLQEKVQNLTARVGDLERENIALSKAVAKDEFGIHEGFAFRRRPDGTFDETPYCPNCHSVMGTVGGEDLYVRAVQARECCKMGSAFGSCSRTEPNARGMPTGT